MYKYENERHHGPNKDVVRLTTEIQQLKLDKANLIAQAEQQAMEARGQKHSLQQCYAAVGANGKGDWNGAEPVIEFVKSIKSLIDAVRLYRVRYNLFDDPAHANLKDPRQMMFDALPDVPRVAATGTTD